MKIFGKTAKEYILPIKFYVLVSVAVVISQYYVALPLDRQYPFALNLTQAAWALMVALSVYKLVKDHGFGMKNVLLLGVIYSFVIHGLKAFFFRVFLFPYNLPPEQALFHILERFLYGSFLVMVIVMILGPVFIYAKKKKLM